MQVWDARAPGHVRYDAAEVGAWELGHVVENRVVHTALAEAAERLGVRVSPPASLARLRLGDRPGALAEADFADDPARADAPPDRTVRARLIVGADGARSRARQLANLRAPGWNYGLKAAVGTVDTDAPPSRRVSAVPPEGPLALLPVADGAKSNVVWTTTPEEADRLVALPHDAFAAEVHDALHGLGRYRYDGGRRRKRPERRGRRGAVRSPDVGGSAHLVGSVRVLVGDAGRAGVASVDARDARGGTSLRGGGSRGRFGFGRGVWWAGRRLNLRPPSSARAARGARFRWRRASPVDTPSRASRSSATPRIRCIRSGDRA